MRRKKNDKHCDYWVYFRSASRVQCAYGEDWGDRRNLAYLVWQSITVPCVFEAVRRNVHNWMACMFAYVCGDENASLYLRARLRRSLVSPYDTINVHTRIGNRYQRVTIADETDSDARQDQLAAHTRRSKFVKKLLEHLNFVYRINEIHNRIRTVASHVGSTQPKSTNSIDDEKITDVSHFIQFKTCCRFVRCQLQTVHDQSLVFVCDA